jgi:hypothetical protein
MSLFGNLQGANIKGPDVVINGDSGSLLPTSTSGMRFSSAEVNQQSKLLSDLQPYSYGQGSVSDDIAQQVTPHKIQKIVPTFTVPSSSSMTAGDETVTHSVSDGDLAFTIKMVHDRSARIKNYNYFTKQNITRAVDIIVNLPTLNYLLRGLQTDMGVNTPNWENWLKATGWTCVGDMRIEHFRPSSPHHYRNLSMFIQDFIRPLGVVIGSENQGGQHQGDNRGAVDFPVDYVVTILVDGLCDNLVNLWRRAEVKAGDDLLLVLAGTQLQNEEKLLKVALDHGDYAVGHPVNKGVHNQFNVDEHAYGGIDPNFFAPPMQKTQYVLNHYAKGKRQMVFDKPVSLLYEVVPTSSSEIEEGYFLGASHHNRGMWHVARSQVQARRQPVMDSAMQTFRNDDANMAGGALLQATIAPVWKSAPRVSHRQEFAPGSLTINKNGSRKHHRIHTDKRDDRPGDYTGHYQEDAEHAYGGAYHRFIVHDADITNPDAETSAAAVTQDPHTSVALQAQQRATKRRGVEGMVDVWSSSAVDHTPQVVARAAVTAAATTAAATAAAATTSSTATASTNSTAGAGDHDDMQVDGVNNTHDTTAAPKVYAQSISMNSGTSQSKAVSVGKVAAKKK